ncbi:MDR family MFS transporter [Bifidobacterium callimiconis]|uniref:MDR family MFS transporter n=1 Tax=Bifidobacterium callimiconis TaxID=2306973 RepID=UPI001F0A1D61|nr:MDR family MFS transporter [Bifidobacterium callimiconis]
MAETRHPETRHDETMKARVDVKHPTLVMLGLYLGAFLGMLSETAMNIALPSLMETFGVTAGTAQWLVVGYMLVIGVVLPFVGLLLKWFRAKNLLIVALAAFLIGSLISGLAPTFPVLLAGRMIQGISTGLVLPMMFSVLLEVFPKNKIGAAMGTTTLIIMFAPAVGPTLSGFFIGMFSWRWIFYFFAVVAAVALACALVFMVNPYELTRPRIDAFSCLTSVIGFGGLVLGVSLISEFGMSPAVIGILIVGVIAVALYSRRQLRMDVPVIDLRAFAIPQFTTGAIVVMMNFGITLCAMYLMPQEIQNGMGVPAAMAGLVMLPGGVINAVVSLLSGRLFDAIGPKILVRSGLVVSVIGLALLMLAGTTSSVGYIIAAHVVLMIGVPLTMSPAQSTALAALPPQLATDGSTIINTLQQVWGAIATAVATVLLGAGQTRAMAVGADSDQAFVTGSRFGFAFAVALACIGLIASLRIRSLSAMTRAEQVPDVAVGDLEVKPAKVRKAAKA